MDPFLTRPTVEVMLAGGLMGTPWWAGLLVDVSLISSGIAAICGAIVGLHAVWRIWRRYHK